MAELKNVSERLDEVSGGANDLDIHMSFEELKKKLMAPFPKFKGEDIQSRKEEFMKRKEEFLKRWMDTNKKFCERNAELVKDMLKLAKPSNEE